MILGIPSTITSHPGSIGIPTDQTNGDSYLSDIFRRLYYHLYSNSNTSPGITHTGAAVGGVRVLVGFVQGLDRLLQDGLHPGSPLLPQTPGDAHHGVGGAVPVGEDAGVQQVDTPRSGHSGECGNTLP